MLESVSPYALLRASIPKPVSSTSTAYDLFSVAQSAAQASPAVQEAPPMRPSPSAQPAPADKADDDASRQAPDEPPAVAPQRTPAALRIPAKRTHYISDIQSRHSAAVRRTTFVTPQQ